tara:strand:- start:10761 stop:11504 length:744 start_codon:yes stop_codon:yes gene_type:complete
MLEIYGIKLYWYGFMYAVSFIIIDYLIVSASKNKKIDIEQSVAEKITFIVLLFAILGGRLGYVIFYDLSYYTSNMEKIFFLWEGGMSFHGGLLGAVAGSIYLSSKHNIGLFNLTDIIALYAPIGLFFGRLGNFINSELYGLQTSGTWGVVFTKVDLHPRHPSMLYEALLEGLVLFLILAVIKSLKPRPGYISGCFLFFYGIFRFAVEFVRIPDAHIGYIYYDWVTMGHLLSMPMILLGVIFMYRTKS